MLRIHPLQQWFALSDPAMQEALHDMPVLREFAKLGEGVERLPDETTTGIDDAEGRLGPLRYRPALNRSARFALRMALC
jgi:hypothetical protein